jgi:ERF superfamily
MAEAAPAPAPEDPGAPVRQDPTTFLSSIPLQSTKVSSVLKAMLQAMNYVKPPKMTKTAVVETSRRTYSYKYAGLKEVMQALMGEGEIEGDIKPERSPYPAFGLMICHQPVIFGRQMFMVTKILHADSGEFIANIYPVIDNINASPQSIGSATTYARRYAIMSLTSMVAEDDDDGQSAKADKEARDAKADRAARDADASRRDAPAEPAREPAAKPSVKKATRAEPGPVDIGDLMQRTMRDNATLSVDELKLATRWYEQQINASENAEALKEFWDAHVGFARALFRQNEEVGKWIRGHYTLTESNLKKAGAA